MQNLLNGWTGLNKSHIVFPGASNPSSSAPKIQQESTSNKHAINQKSDHKVGKIKRSNSQSDLLKEKAIRKAISRKDSEENHSEVYPIAQRRISDASQAKSFALSQSEVSKSVSNSNSNSTQQHDNTIQSRRGSLDSSTIQSSAVPHNTGQYINENAFANQQRSMKLAERTASQKSLGNMKKVLIGTEENDSQSLNSTDAVSILNRSDHQDDSVISSLGGSQAGDRDIHKQSLIYKSRPAVITEYQGGSDGEKSVAAQINTGEHCNKCHDSQKYIIELEKDLEYLRSTILNSEYVCVSCEHRNPIHSGSSVASKYSAKSNKSKLSMTSGKLPPSVGGASGTSKRKGRYVVDSVSTPENMTLAASSQRLIDTTTRYKRQIEQISKDTSRWQNDMHMKLSKLAMLCKDLNDESASRKEQADLARSDRDSIRQERNAMVSELEILRARVDMYEKQEIEHAELRQILQETENHTIMIADKEISQRDEIIEQLTSKLNEALRLLDDERNRRSTASG